METTGLLGYWFETGYQVKVITLTRDTTVSSQMINVKCNQIKQAKGGDMVISLWQSSINIQHICRNNLRCCVIKVNILPESNIEVQLVIVKQFHAAWKIIKLK